MHFEIIGEIEEIETIAVGRRIRDIMRLRKRYGPGGGANSKALPRSGFKAERSTMLNCTGMKPTTIGRKKVKIKRLLD